MVGKYVYITRKADNGTITNVKRNSPLSESDGGRIPFNICILRKAAMMRYGDLLVARASSLAKAVAPAIRQFGQAAGELFA